VGGAVRSYGITKGTFWSGPTGRDIRVSGADTQLVALYLFTGPNANAIGLYYLPFELLLKHVALPGNRIRKSLLDLDHLHFAHYDDISEVVWVREMAYHQLGEMRPGDGRVRAVSRLYAELPPNPYLGSFFDRYAEKLQLQVPRRDAISKGGPRGTLTPPHIQIQIQFQTFQVLRTLELCLIVRRRTHASGRWTSGFATSPPNTRRSA
jgi:hypothetical protein